jgi:hypothetical protein
LLFTLAMKAEVGPRYEWWGVPRIGVGRGAFKVVCD